MRPKRVLLAALLGACAATAGCLSPRPTFRSDEARVPLGAAVDHADAAPVSDAKRRTDDLLRNARLTELEPPREPAEGTWSKLLGRLRKPKPEAVSLPRTDLASESVFDEPPPAATIPDDF